jgi:predicted O-methyltransferase YrrM
MQKFPDNLLLELHTPVDPVLDDLYRQTHIKFVNPNRICGHLQGRLLEFISGMKAPHNILEIGTFTGYATICLARGLRLGGRIITIEPNDELLAFSNSYFRKAGVAERVIQITGRAQDTVPGLDMKFDLIYIDGDKREYAEYFNLAINKLATGGLILVDNVLWGGKVLEKDKRDPQTRGIIEFNEMIKKQTGIENVILPAWDGLMIIRKKGARTGHL